ncbi:DNA/RNA nuclease SfsA [Candidatus Bathyarchaeota archaeon]|nr:DNA/RNA nuclease SfsA [Candidatus Bathyarchaeota archaeon]
MVSFIKVEGNIVAGVFEQRLTRFSASVRIKGKIVKSFLPNPGRMVELLAFGTEVILNEASGGERKTSYDLIGVYYKDQRISLDSRVPNKLVLEALKNKDLPEFLEHTSIKLEHSYGHTRFDFLLSNEHEFCLLEVKSCTLVKNGVALFPDAKTKRGSRHVRHLLKAKNEGYRACILFMIQRTDAYVFAPNDEADPEFGRILRHAAARGVEVYAYCSEFVGDRIILKRKIKVDLQR